MVVWLVSEIRLHRCTFLKNVRTIEHWVLACGNFSYHLESEFVPFTVCKLVGWSFFIVYPSLSELGQQKKPLVHRLH